ncbi:MAG: hypothetical protein EBT45_06960, partial [Alphaproteobacteria bacterium]|nr:hypothetical protein [Alphaproteobacteria bacterium]
MTKLVDLIKKFSKTGTKNNAVGVCMLFSATSITCGGGGNVTLNILSVNIQSVVIARDPKLPEPDEEGYVSAPLKPRCVHDTCTTIATFAPIGQKPLFCKSHIPAGLECSNVVSKMCVECKTRRAYYGISGVNTHCGDCKEDEMINTTAKLCEELGCNTRANYGHEGGDAVYCNEHKTLGMIDVTHRRCRYVDCVTFASYGYENGPAEYCTKHKKPTMIELRGLICPGYGGVPCPVETKLCKGRDFCISCDPDPERKKNRKLTETKCFKILDKELPITDHQYHVDFASCDDVNRHRAYIDAVIITPDVFVCIEIDEFAHINYDQKCEESRM